MTQLLKHYFEHWPVINHIFCIGILWLTIKACSMEGEATRDREQVERFNRLESPDIANELYERMD
jgi:hypothetical protein